MRKKIIATLLVCILVLGANLSVYAMTDEQSTAIQSFIEEAERISRAPGISVAVVVAEDRNIKKFIFG